MHRALQELRTYFVTFSTAGRRRLFQVHERAALMMDTLLHYRQQGRYLLHSYVVMPDHVHVLLTPASDVPLEKAIQFIKGGFSFRLKSKGDVWEREHFDKRLANADNYKACVTYIEANPAKAGLVGASEEYCFSSAKQRLDPKPQWMHAGVQG